VGEQVTGNPSDGSMTTLGFFEPAAAWWRITVDAISGGNAAIDISGTRVNT
jgi:hypothetical protein